MYDGNVNNNISNYNESSPLLNIYYELESELSISHDYLIWFPYELKERGVNSVPAQQMRT